MAQYQEYFGLQWRLMPVRLDEQAVPGMFERALGHTVDDKLDWALIENRQGDIWNPGNATRYRTRRRRHYYCT
jgi:hypothetical protein